MYEARLRAALPGVRQAIAEAALRGGRRAADIRLVAVTKSHPIDAVEAAARVGLEDVGENRVEELEWKRAELPESPLRWHMVGHVQSRKAGRVAALADLTHSVDTLKLARRLSAAGTGRDRDVDVLVQVNTSGEDAKSGLDLEAAVEAIHEMCGLPRLRVLGLMTMAPFGAPESVLRATFVGLREVLVRARALDDNVGSELSMGMSNDFGIAIEEGSTMVRLGTVLFGKRPT